jgi:signal peptidase I
MKNPWFSIFRIKGESMAPTYTEGDFVLLAKSPSVINKLSIDDDIVFEHQTYNKMIKRIIAIQPDNRFLVRGLNPASISIVEIGPIDKNIIIGKVIFHISK